jgi:hypothetical protein
MVTRALRAYQFIELVRRGSVICVRRTIHHSYGRISVVCSDRCEEIWNLNQKSLVIDSERSDNAVV